MKASQNSQYGLPQEELPECEDDMGVQVGDNDSRTVTNNYYNGNPDQPTPTPPPTNGKIPPWLLVALILPWILLTSLLIGWLLNKYGGSTPDPNAIIWELDIDAENPEPTPEPTEEPVI